VCMCRYLHIRKHRLCTQKHGACVKMHAYMSICLRACVGIYVYTYMYEKIPSVHIFTYLHAGFTCVCIYYIYVCQVYMRMYTYLHIWLPSLLVCVYMFTYMHTEFTSVAVYVYTYAH